MLGPAPILEGLGLYLSNRVTVTDCGEGRRLHDCSLATARTTPPQCQRGSRLGAVATCIGMLHWWHSPSKFGSATISHPHRRGRMEMPHSTRVIVCASVALAQTAICAVPAAAQSVAEFYKGKTIAILMGTQPG